MGECPKNIIEHSKLTQISTTERKVFFFWNERDYFRRILCVQLILIFENSGPTQTTVKFSLAGRVPSVEEHSIRAISLLLLSLLRL
jgi:hypothetical protein